MQSYDFLLIKILRKMLFECPQTKEPGSCLNLTKQGPSLSDPDESRGCIEGGP